MCQVTHNCKSWLLNSLSVCTSAVVDSVLEFIISKATHVHMIRQLMWPNYWSKIKCTAQTLRQSINAPDRLLIPLSWPLWRGWWFTAPLVAGWLNYTKFLLVCATQSEVLPKSFEQNPSIQKDFPPLPYSPEWGSGWNEQCPHLEQAHWFGDLCAGEDRPTSGSPTLLS